MKKETIDIIMAGVGGQGLVLLTDMLCEVAYRAGYEVKSNDVVGLSQRGGKVWGSVRFGSKVYSPNVRPGTADFVLALEPLEGLRWQNYLKADGYLLMSTAEIYPVFAIAEQAPYPHDFMKRVREDVKVSAHDIQAASVDMGTVKVANVMLMGLLAKHLDIPKNIWHEVIEETVPRKFLDENIKAFEYGMTLK